MDRCLEGIHVFKTAGAVVGEPPWCECGRRRLTVVQMEIHGPEPSPADDLEAWWAHQQGGY